jgi:acyl-CoA dehydrogenase
MGLASNGLCAPASIADRDNVLKRNLLYDCVQFHGGTGYMRETPVERMSRDARIQSIGGGATEVMLEEIAKRL